MTDLSFPHPDFGPVTIRQEGSSWIVDWSLSFACHNGFDAVKLAAEIVALETKAHGDYEVSLVIRRDPDIEKALEGDDD